MDSSIITTKYLPICQVTASFECSLKLGKNVEHNVSGVHHRGGGGLWGNVRQARIDRVVKCAANNPVYEYGHSVNRKYTRGGNGIHYYCYTYYQ